MQELHIYRHLQIFIKYIFPTTLANCSSTLE